MQTQHVVLVGMLNWGTKQTEGRFLSLCIHCTQMVGLLGASMLLLSGHILSRYNEFSLLCLKTVDDFVPITNIKFTTGSFVFTLLTPKINHGFSHCDASDVW